MKLQVDNAEFTADVWHARMVLRFLHRPSTAYGIARYLIDQGVVITSGLNVLRDRVHVAINRVALLETLEMPGQNEPVWPALSLEEAIANATPTPYDNQNVTTSTPPAESL